MATELLTPLRDYLIAQGIVRKPSVAGVGSHTATNEAWLPPLWIEPRLGVPAPGEGENVTERGYAAVLGVFETAGVAPERHEGFIRDQHVQFRLRAATAPVARDVKEAIRAALNDRRGWTMAGLRIEESLLWTDWQRLGSDDQGYDYVATMSFVLWGPPMVPEPIGP